MDSIVSVTVPTVVSPLAFLFFFVSAVGRKHELNILGCRFNRKKQNGRTLIILKLNCFMIQYKVLFSPFDLFLLVTTSGSCHNII